MFGDWISKAGKDIVAALISTPLPVLLPVLLAVVGVSFILIATVAFPYTVSPEIIITYGHLRLSDIVTYDSCSLRRDAAQRPQDLAWLASPAFPATSCRAGHVANAVTNPCIVCES